MATIRRRAQHPSCCCLVLRRSKGKNKEKVNNAILFTKESFEKMVAEVPKYKMITISILADRLRVNCSLARRAIAVLLVRAALGPAVAQFCSSLASSLAFLEMRRVGITYARRLNFLPPKLFV